MTNNIENSLSKKEFVDIIGKKFGMLTVIEKTNNRTKKSSNYYYKCKCDCGNIKEMLKWTITNGRSIGCGCRKFLTGKNHGGFIGYEEIHGNLWTMIKKNAKTRNIPFEITIQYVWELFLKQNRKCSISGESILFSKWLHKKGERPTASLDRINSSNGYIKNNVQWVHKDINMMKQQFKQDYFLSLCKEIVKFNEIKNIC